MINESSLSDLRELMESAHVQLNLLLIRYWPTKLTLELLIDLLQNDFLCSADLIRMYGMRWGKCRCLRITRLNQTIWGFFVWAGSVLKPLTSIGLIVAVIAPYAWRGLIATAKAPVLLETTRSFRVSIVQPPGGEFKNHELPIFVISSLIWLSKWMSLDEYYKHPESFAPFSVPIPKQIEYWL